MNKPSEALPRSNKILYFIGGIIFILFMGFSTGVIIIGDQNGNFITLNDLINDSNNNYNYSIPVNIADPKDINGNLEVAVQDQFSPGVNLYLSEELAVITLIDHVAIGDTEINISSPILPVAGNYLCLKEEREFQSEILTVVSLGGNNYTVTVAAGADKNFSLNGGCSLRNVNMAVDGSVTPHYFTISPGGTDYDWDVYTVNYHMEDNLDMDSSKFGSGTELSNGIWCYIEDGIRKNLAVFRSNGDFIHEGFGFNPVSKAPAGVYAYFGELNYHNTFGVTLRLNNETSDKIICEVRDNLITRVEELHFKMFGHQVE